MKKYLFTIILTILAHKCFSCKCFGDYRINFYDYHSSYNKIFTGKVIIIKKLDEYHNWVTFKVIKNYAGENTNQLITIKLSWEGGNCGFTVKINEIWLLTLVKVNGQLTTNRCLKNSLAGTDQFKENWTQLEKIASFKNGKAKLLDFKTRKKILAEGIVKEGLPVGVWKYYNNSGSVVHKGKYVNGKKEGLWTNFNFDGLSRTRTEFSYKNGSLKRSISYFDNVKSREIEYFDNGSIDYIERVYENNGIDRTFEHAKNGKVFFKKYNKAGKVIEADCWEGNE